MGEIDTAQTIKIMPSARKYRLSAFGSALLSVLFLGLTMGWWGGSRPMGLEYLEMWAGTLVLALVTLALIWILATRIGKPLLVISPQGLSFPSPLRPVEIPWKQVVGLGEWSFQGRDCITLKLDPAFETRALGARYEKVVKAFRTSFGFDGLPLMVAQSTETDGTVFDQMVTAFWNTYGPASEPQELNQEPSKAEL